MVAMDLSSYYPAANPKPEASGASAMASPVAMGTPPPHAPGGAGPSAPPPPSDDAPPPYTTLPRSPSEAGGMPFIGKMLFSSVLFF